MATLRPFPYPYRVMACVSVDVDMGALGGEEHRYVRTLANTTYGPGLGMPVWTDSFWLFDQPGFIEQTGATQYFAMYANGDRHFRADGLERAILAGYVNACHGFGQFNSSIGSNDPADVLPLSQAQKDAAQAWWLGSAFGYRTPAWYDHNPYSNQHNRVGFGYNANSNKALWGADQNGSHYHTDRTIGRAACRYVWHREYSDGFLQSDIDYFQDPEITNTADYVTNGRMTVPAGQLLYPVTLRDGSKVWGFDRWTSPDSAMGQVWTTDQQWLREETGRLQKLTVETGYWLHYNHYNGFANGGYLPWMKTQWDAGIILPAQQNHILDYAMAYQNVRWSEVGGNIRITHVEDECFGDFIPEVGQLRGVTFLTDSENPEVYINGALVEESNLDRNYDSVAGKWAIGFKWYPVDTTDYMAMSLVQVDALFGDITAPAFTPYVPDYHPLAFDLLSGEGVDLLNLDVFIRDREYDLTAHVTEGIEIALSDEGFGVDDLSVEEWSVLGLALQDTGAGTDILVLERIAGSTIQYTLSAYTLEGVGFTLQDTGVGTDILVLEAIVGNIIQYTLSAYTLEGVEFTLQDEGAGRDVLRFWSDAARKKAAAFVRSGKIISWR